MRKLVSPRSAAGVGKGLWRVVPVVLLLATGLGACDTARSVRPLNRNPVVRSLTAFPLTISPGDSALVTCVATDADGDTLLYFWDSDCRLLSKGSQAPGATYENHVVVYPGACNAAPVDTGWVSCSVSDHRGGYVVAGFVQIIVKQ
jgi:hypothetical protein